MRTDAVAVILEVVARMRQLDPRLKVTWEPGWERLGNGLAARYVGGIVHDTTTPSSPARPFPTQNMLRVGRPDLSGPIANFGGPVCTVDAPWIHVVAAFPANHAGASGGRSMGPLPKTSLFNPTVLGLEIDFSGLTLMPAGQMYVGHLWARAVADVLADGNLEYVRAHFETSVTGKIDISYAPGKSYDMAAFRRDAAQLTSGSTPAPLEDDDMPLFIAAPGRGHALVWPGFVKYLPGGSGVNQEELDAAIAEFGPITFVSTREFDVRVALRMNVEMSPQAINGILDAPIERNEKAGGGFTTLRTQTHWADYNFRTVTPEAVAKLVGTPDVDALAVKLGEALRGKTSITREDVKSAVQEALREGTGGAAVISAQ